MSLNARVRVRHGAPEMKDTVGELRFMVAVDSHPRSRHFDGRRTRKESRLEVDHEEAIAHDDRWTRWTMMINAIDNASRALILGPLRLARLGMRPGVSNLDGTVHLLLRLDRRRFRVRMDRRSQGPDTRPHALQRRRASRLDRHRECKYLLVVWHLQISHRSRFRQLHQHPADHSGGVHGREQTDAGRECRVWRVLCCREHGAAVDRLLRRKLEIIRVRYRDPDAERLHHPVDPARECSMVRRQRQDRQSRAKVAADSTDQQEEPRRARLRSLRQEPDCIRYSYGKRHYFRSSQVTALSEERYSANLLLVLDDDRL